MTGEDEFWRDTLTAIGDGSDKGKGVVAMRSKIKGMVKVYASKPRRQECEKAVFDQIINKRELILASVDCKYASYIWVLARNVIKNTKRKIRRLRECELVDDADYGLAIDGPEVDLMHTEAIEKAVSSLSEKQREVVDMCRENLSNREIAARLEVCEQSASRMRKSIRDELELHLSV